MSEQVEKRYPRVFALFILAMTVVVIGSLELAQWYAQAAPVDSNGPAIVGWALGAGAVLVMNRLGRWLDEREATLARLERGLGGDA